MLSLLEPRLRHLTFMLSYRYKAYEPGVKTQAVEMVLNGSGIRATARVLKINNRQNSLTSINTLTGPTDIE